MRVNKRLTVAFRRKREEKTDYRKRLRMVRSLKLRVVVRRSANHTITQLVRYDAKGDVVLAQADSRELKKANWPFRGNLPSAYLTGYLLAKKAKKVKHDGESVFDLGFHTHAPGSRIYAVLKGCVDGGLAVTHDPQVLPSDERVSGAHIASYAKDAKQGTFAHVTKHGGDPKNIQKLFEATKKSIEQMVK